MPLKAPTIRFIRAEMNIVVSMVMGLLGPRMETWLGRHKIAIGKVVRAAKARIKKCRGALRA